MLPLVLLKEGEVAEIVVRSGVERISDVYVPSLVNSRCRGDCSRCRCRNNSLHSLNKTDFHIESIGLTPGKHVEMITNSGAGPLLLRVDECRIAVGRGAAMKIFVRRIDK